MKKIIVTSLLVTMLLMTGCGKKENKNNDNKKENNIVNTPVVEEQISYEGLEFVNVGASNGVIKTVAINNTKNNLQNIKFSMKIMDGNGNTIVELTDEIKETVEKGTTKEVETKVDADLSNAASIEYSIIK